MCGIFGYTGTSRAAETVVDGLEKLEYRGYDSAGVLVLSEGDPILIRTVGATRELRGRMGKEPPPGHTAIGHTRWATHGQPSERNAHPHRCGQVFVVHNGIIENDSEIRRALRHTGTAFSSDTDSELIGHLIDQNMTSGMDFKTAVLATLPELSGTYSFLAVTDRSDSPVIAVHMGSPLIIGKNAEGLFLSSDAHAFPPEVSEILPMSRGDVVVLSPGTLPEFILGGKIAPGNTFQHWSVTPETQGRGIYPHYMLKEIHEQPGVVRNLLAKLLEKADGHLKIRLPEKVSKKLHNARRILIIACGTSYHAGLFGKYLLESIGLVSVSVEVASEFRYRHPVVDPERDLAILITQSGETADTLSCLRLLKELGVPQIVLTNVAGSTAVREADESLFLLAGPELGVASTKAFLAQIVYMMFFALDLGLKKPHPEHSTAHIHSILDEFFRIPALMEETLNLSSSIRELVKPFTHLPSTLFLGRGRDYPLALEGALKLKEISYIHAEGYPSGELKHGPLALVSDSMPVFALVSGSELLPKILGNLKEVHSRSGIIISIAPASLKGALTDIVNHQILLPPVGDFFLPLLSTIVLQFVSYHMADLKGFDVDRPRNLAKSVTVE